DCKGRSTPRSRSPSTWPCGARGAPRSTAPHPPPAAHRSSSSLSAPPPTLAERSPNAEGRIVHHQVERETKQHQLEPRPVSGQGRLQQHVLCCRHGAGEHRRYPPVGSLVAKHAGENATGP